MNKHVIKLYTDFCCPFCYVGKGIMEKLKKDSDAPDFTLETYHIEIHPDTPAEGYDLQQRFPHASIPNLYARMNKSGEEYGKSFVTPKLLANTRKATLISEIAKEYGDDVFEKYSELMFSAYFKEQKNTDEEDVLKKAVEESGMKWDEIKEKMKDEKYEKICKKNHEDSRKYGCNGVPHFVIDEKIKISGAQPYKIFKKILKDLDKEMSKKK